MTNIQGCFSTEMLFAIVFCPPILSCFNDPMKQTFLSNTSVAAIISMVTFVLHADDPVALSRNKAVSLAFANNRDLKIATLEIERAKTRVRWSGRLENPELELSVNDDGVGLDEGEGNYEVAFSQRFPLTAKLKRETGLRKYQVILAEAEIAERRRELAGEVDRSVVELLATREKIRIGRESGALNKEILTFLEEKAKLGEVSKLDVIQANLNGRTLAQEVDLLLTQLNISTVEEFVKFLPSVTTATLGPGQSNIYIRGLSIGSLGTQGSGTNGPWPNVAVYLDEQSTQVPGRNLDVYAADFERIEVLTGPQGTLFGAGAQAGVLRYITNKPRFNEMSGNVKVGYANTADGDDSYNFEGVVNIPLIDDKLAMRLVGYMDHRGGYIDNVYSTFTRQGTDLGFARRTGGVVPTDSLVIDNADIAGDNINEAEYSGVRGSLKWQVTDDWDALLAVAYQKIEGEGVFYQHPNGAESGCGVNPNCTTSTQRLKPLQVTVFTPGSTEDEFVNTALTVTGKVGTLDLVYAGAYLTREAQSLSDYTNYARGVWGTYYQCTGF